MPLPKPGAGESQDEFISRCMGDTTTNADFPDQKQRAAICYSQWNGKKEVNMEKGKTEKCLACETGATSFEELDKLKVQEEMAEEMKDLSMYANVMTGNIFASPDIPIEEKPNALKKLMDGFVNRVKKLAGSKKEGGYVEKEEPVILPPEDIMPAEKQATKTEDGIAFRASDFAVVPDPETPTDWKLRLAENSSGNFTVQQIARAITAMQPGGFRGNKVELGPGDKAQAIERITTAIGKSDGDDTQKENLKKRLDMVKAYQKGAFYITKDANGVMRWIGFPSNKWRDRDNPPQIIEEAAHKEFVEHMEKTGEYPVLLGWHTPGTKLGVADFAEYIDGFLVMGGTIDKDKYKEAENLAEISLKEKIGMSHGFVYKYSDEPNEVIGWYRTWEVSHLPLSKAANLWTAIDILQKEVKEMPLTDERKTYLEGIYGKDTIDKMLTDIETNGKTLASMGVEFKEVLPENELVVEANEDEVVGKAVKAIVENEAFKAMIASIGDMSEKLKELTEVTIPGLQKQVIEAKGVAVKAEEKAQKSVDDIIADAFQPRSKGFIPSQAAPEPTEAEKKLAPSPESPVDQGLVELFTSSFNGPSPIQ